MRIVSFGDIHMSLQTIEHLAPELEKADLVILSGDLTNFGGREDAEQVLAATQRHARAVLAVSGNLDRPEVIDVLRARGISLHDESRHVGNLGIFGCGGSNLTPFHTPRRYAPSSSSINPRCASPGTSMNLPASTASAAPPW
ncbi:MAG: metallophosphoesterase family protein [Candidatus Binatia bacterium]